MSVFIWDVWCEQY